MTGFIKWIILLLLLLPTVVPAQDELDSLWSVLDDRPQDSIAVVVLNQIASKTFYGNPKITDSITSISIHLSDSLGLAGQKAIGLKLKGISHAIRGRYDDARTYYEQALDLFLKLNEAREVAALYYTIGIAYLETGKNNLAEDYYKRALRTQRDMNDSLGMANTYIGISSLHKKQTQLDKALDYLDSAMMMYKELDKPLEISILNTRKANIFMERNDYPGALEEVQKALKYNESVGLEAKSAISYHTIGTIYYHLNEYDKAQEYFERSIAIKKELGLERGIAVTLSNMASLLSERDQLEESLEAFKEVISLYTRLNSSCEIIYAQMSIGQIYRKSGKRDSAYYYYQKARERSDSCGNQQVLASVMIDLGEMYMEEDRDRQAEDLLLDGYEIGESTGILSSQQSAADGLYELYKQQGQTDQALHYLEKSKVLADSMYNEEKNRKIARLESQYRFDQEKALLNEKYKRQEMEQEAELNQQILIRNGAVIIAVLVMIMAIISLVFIIKNKRKNQKLSEQNEKLQQLNLNKAKLLSLLAHDLRAPMTNISGLFTLIKFDKFSEQQLEEYSRDINFKIKSLLEFLDNVLHWSKSNFKNIAPKVAETDLKQILEETIALLNHALERKNIKANLTVESQHIIADASMLKVVFRNVLSNAIKFSNEHGQIDVEVSEQDKKVSIDIRDYGVGMTEEVQSGIFSEALTPKPGTSNEIGAGMGLYLSKDFIDRHHGTIKVSSTYGQGTTFQIELPKNGVDQPSS